MQCTVTRTVPFSVYLFNRSCSFSSFCCNNNNNNTSQQREYPNKKGVSPKSATVVNTPSPSPASVGANLQLYFDSLWQPLPMRELSGCGTGENFILHRNEAKRPLFSSIWFLRRVWWRHTWSLNFRTGRASSHRRASPRALYGYHRGGGDRQHVRCIVCE